MELEQVITLIKAVSDSKLTGFSLEEGNIKLRLEKQNGSVQVLKKTEEREYTAEEKEYAAAERENAIEKEKISDVKEAEPKLKGEALKSPLVGTFYSSSSPEAEPFVKAGDQVKKGQVLGIIEAMKLMNEIEAEKDGIVEAVLAENEQMVEYGQTLFSIL